MFILYNLSINRILLYIIVIVFELKLYELKNPSYKGHRNNLRVETEIKLDTETETNTETNIEKGKTQKQKQIQTLIKRQIQIC